MSTDNVIPVPTLSTFGWIDSKATTAQRIDFLWAHFFESDNKQSTLYGKNVSSLQGLIAENSGDITGTANAVQAALTQYLRRYFADVNVNASTKLQDATTSASKMVLVLSLFVTENGVEYSVSYEVTSINGQSLKFTNLNNSPQAST